MVGISDQTSKGVPERCAFLIIVVVGILWTEAIDEAISVDLMINSDL
jgi:hypothetical protein